MKPGVQADRAVAADLLVALEEAIGAIETLPEEALGMARDGMIFWPIRNELLDSLKSVVAKAKGSDK